jgi:pilus assembly protein CpaE
LRLPPQIRVVKADANTIKETTMQKRLKILFLGTDTEAARLLETHLNKRDLFSVSSNYKTESNGSALWSLLNNHNKPDIIMLSIDEQWEKILATVPNSIHKKGQVLVVIGPEEDSQAMRMAMKMGARDYLSAPFSVAEITESLLQINSKYVDSSIKTKGQVVSIINAKGGSGGSFIATNIAHLFSEVENQRTALLDFDFQYGVQSLSLDLPMEHDLAEVLSMAPNLDPMSIKGYLSKHKSGIHLLAERQDNIVLSGDIDLSNLSSLIENIEKGFDQVVVDLPRQVDPIFSTVVSHSHHILLVLQQTVAHVRDTKRLYGILVNDLDISPDRIILVVNRYDKDNSVTLDAIDETVGHDNFATLTNDFKRVAMVTDMAMPLYSYAPNAPLTTDLLSLCRQLSGVIKKDKKSIMNKVFGGLLNR